MSIVASKIERRLAGFPDNFAALRNLALKHLEEESVVDEEETMLIGHMPKIGPEAYAISLFAPARKEWFERLRDNLHKSIPDSYRAFLLVTNGCFVFDLSLFGLAPSMQRSPWLLDRQKRECHDLYLANRDWISDFEVSQNQFHFGGRALSASENIGYFMELNSSIRALRKQGETVGEWADFSSFLADELRLSEQFARTPSSYWH